MGGRERKNWTRDATRRMLRSQAPKCCALTRRERRKVLGASRRRFIGSASNALLLPVSYTHLTLPTIPLV